MGGFCLDYRFAAGMGIFVLHNHQPGSAIEGEMQETTKAAAPAVHTMGTLNLASEPTQ